MTFWLFGVHKHQKGQESWLSFCTSSTHQLAGKRRNAKPAYNGANGRLILHSSYHRQQRSWSTKAGGLHCKTSRRFQLHHLGLQSRSYSHKTAPREYREPQMVRNHDAAHKDLQPCPSHCSVWPPQMSAQKRTSLGDHMIGSGLVRRNVGHFRARTDLKIPNPSLHCILGDAGSIRTPPMHLSHQGIATSRCKCPRGQITQPRKQVSTNYSQPSGRSATF